MKKITILPIFIIMALSITGCTAQMNQMMQSWEGHHYSKVVAKWGPPTRVIDESNGGKMMIWEETKTVTSPGYAQTQPYGAYSKNVLMPTSYRTTYIPPQTNTYTKSRTFWVNSEGIIYRWAWKGF
jgi:hypothetical protein